MQVYDGSRKLIAGVYKEDKAKYADIELTDSDFNQIAIMKSASSFFSVVPSFRVEAPSGD